MQSANSVYNGACLTLSSNLAALEGQSSWAIVNIPFSRGPPEWNLRASICSKAELSETENLCPRAGQNLWQQSQRKGQSSEISLRDTQTWLSVHTSCLIMHALIHLLLDTLHSCASSFAYQLVVTAWLNRKGLPTPRDADQINHWYLLPASLLHIFT